MRVGVAGLGRMGAAMAARLIDVGHQVTVWNRSPGKADDLVKAGAKLAKSPQEVAQASDAVVTILTNADAITQMYEGAAGLLAGDVKGKIFIEMSTVQPHEEEAIAKRVKAAGARFVECPVGGTVGPARNGQLLGMAGGTPEDFDAAKPLLLQLCRRVEYVGPAGAGASVKLAVNLPLLVYYQAFAEAYVLMKHLKLDPKFVIDFLADTSGGPNVLRARGPAIATALSGGEVTPVTFDLELIRKDLNTMIKEAKLRGASLPVVERVLEVYDQAAKDGWDKKDGATLPSYWPGKTGKA